MVDNQKTGQIIGLLREQYPHAKCELDFGSPFELLVATILSAQCTDQRVNIVTPVLFAKYKSPADLLNVRQEDLEADIRTCGLFRSKAKYILSCARALCRDYAGQVPTTAEALQKLPGVGRKTACVVLYNAFGVPALGVDTHVFRVAQRLGLATGNTPDKVERELCAQIAQAEWGDVHHLLIWHGRRTCSARKPLCGMCSLARLCAYKNYCAEEGCHD